MKNSLILTILYLFAFSMVASGQSRGSENADVFSVPESYFSTFLASPMDTPAEIEPIEILIDREKKAPFIGWKLRNVSEKSITGYVVSFRIETNIREWWGSVGSVTYSARAKAGQPLILPGETYSTYRVERDIQFPSELRSFLDRKTTDGKDQFLRIYGMIVELEFSDGATYRGDPSFLENPKSFRNSKLK